MNQALSKKYRRIFFNYLQSSNFVKGDNGICTFFHKEYDINFNLYIKEDIRVVECGYKDNYLVIEINVSDKEFLSKYVDSLKQCRMHIANILRTIKIEKIL